MKYFMIVAILLCLTGCNEKEDIKIELEGNPTTGYDWNCVAQDNSIIKIEKEYEQYNDNVVGSNGLYEFEIEGLKEGKTTLNCTYSRSFEENSTINEKSYLITVDSKKNVSYTENK